MAPAPPAPDLGSGKLAPLQSDTRGAAGAPRTVVSLRDWRTVAVLLVVGVIAVVGAIAVNDSQPDEDVYIADAARSVERTSTIKRAPVKADPLTTDGLYKVGTDVVPGEYSYTANDGRSGYWATCPDANCSDVLENDVTGVTGYLTIAPSVKYGAGARVGDI